MAYLFIDGLDEALYDEQFDLLDTLKTVPASFFFTSRPLHIDRNLDLQQVLATDGQRGSVIKKICESSCGMFLHASLMVESVRHCTSSRHVMEKLDKLPAKLDVLYDEAFKRIETQPEEHAALAKRVLLWVVYAYRPLTVEEMRYAVASDPKVDWETPKNLVPESLMVSVCCGLIVFEEKKNFQWDWADGEFDPHIHTARLVPIDYTALDAVKRVLERGKTPPHCLLAEICVERLMNCSIPTLIPEWPIQLWGGTSYAYALWYLHATESIRCPAQANARPVASILRFLARCEAFPVEVPEIGIASQYDLFTVPIHLIAYYHLPAILPLIDPRINERTGWGRSALSLAVLREDTVMAELLLKLDGIDVNLQDNDGNTALMFAAQRNDVVMAELLLKLDGIDVNLQDKAGSTALMDVARRKDVVMAGLLLNLDGINVNLSDDDGNTALMVAARKGSAEVVKSLLLDLRTDVNKRNKNGETALHCALYGATSGHIEAAWRLFDAPGIDIDAADAYRRTPRILDCPRAEPEPDRAGSRAGK
ncbi:ankyrin repeat-containing domain protein [Coprinopsis sp. MPI-PUGE-AT-0042]|nr:ankyrin repeat-containing domain protein [Coprinopsis sp. MPI-PUGE-AT-0042]